MPTDKEMLDWLDSQTTGYGIGLVFRMSTRGRGWRLHETSSVRSNAPYPMPTVREAIASAMDKESSK